MTEAKVITVPDGKICDYIDGKFRNDTPEEYVRQTIEKRLVGEQLYSRSQIEIEYPIKLGSAKKRADIVIFAKDCPDENKTQENVRLIIECKKDSIPANSAKEGIEQLKSYMAACSNCEWGMWSNGKERQVFKKYKDENGKFQFQNCIDIPTANGSTETIDRPTRISLKKACDDNLLFAFRTCHNYIYVNDGLQKQPAFFELLKVIFCKIEDERNLPKPLEFFATTDELENPDGQLTVKNRISEIFKRVKSNPKYKTLFDSNDEIKLVPRSLSHIVSELQQYSLLNTNIDIKGKAYEEIVGANLRGDRGEFFTPRNVMKMAVKMINPGYDDKVLDSSCGTGGFLVTAMTHVIDKLKTEHENQVGLPRRKWNTETYGIFQERIAEIAGTHYFGFDINPDLVRATKMNMVMNNDGSGNILQTNSLLPPHEWSQDFKNSLAAALNIDANAIRTHKDLGHFDIIVTNPPFGSKIPIDDKTVLEQFDLAHRWTYDRDAQTYVMSSELQSSVPPEILFIERCYQFLKPGGRMGIVLPDSILGSPGLTYIREWLIRNTKIIASIDLHADTFQPRNGTQTSVLFLQKKTEEEKKKEQESGAIANYDIFMAMAERIGHDKRGNQLFKRDNDGNEIMVSDEETIETENGTITQQVSHKLDDDQTQDIPAIFEEWKRKEGISW